jgi:Tfp pilus assembly protein PilZ
MNYAEKRKSIRVPVHLDASFRHGDKKYNGRLLNLSVDGCFLQSAELLHAGELIDVNFRIPDQDVEFNGKIMWVGSADKSQPSFGMGIHFENPIPSRQEALETYIRELLNN